MDKLYGISLTIAIAIVAYFLSSYVAIGSVAIAIILAIILANSIKLSSKFSSGITYSEKSILAFAIALMGINLDFSILIDLGLGVIGLIILGMIVTIYSSIFIGKAFGLDKRFALMLGIGNGVCGSSAIGATKNIVKAKDDEVGISIAIVNLLGTIGIFLVPAIAIMIGFNDVNSGILVGNTLQAVGQVVAGGFSLSDSAGQSATIVKMGRVLMLTPLIVILLIIFKNDVQKNINNNKFILSNIPMFIVGFIVLSIIASLQILPSYIIDIISSVSKYSLIVAMAGIGLKITFSSIKTNGKIAFIVASIVFVIQILFTSIYLFLI
jgi:uncharacterized integral membrane protein (TIGR00698 family)